MTYIQGLTLGGLILTWLAAIPLVGLTLVIIGATGGGGGMLIPWSAGLLAAGLGILSVTQGECRQGKMQLD